MKKPMNARQSDHLALYVHRNEKGAVEALVRGYQNQLFRFALRLLRNHMDAQEVTQDAFVRAIKALTCAYDAERCRRLALRPWLFRITRNLAFNRSRARLQVHEEPLDSGSRKHGAAAGRAFCLQADPSPDGRAEALNIALERLDERSRELVLLRFIEEMPYAEVAAVAGITEAAARAKVFRALRNLRKTLESLEDDDAL